MNSGHELAADHWFVWIARALNVGADLDPRLERRGDHGSTHACGIRAATTEAPPFTTSIDPGTTAGPPGQYQSIFPHFFNFRNLFGSESFL